MSELKYYITYAHFKAEYQGEQNIVPAMEEWKKKVEEYGCKVKLCGISYGTTEPLVVVIKGKPENFIKLTPNEAPYNNTRTNMVAVF